MPKNVRQDGKERCRDGWIVCVVPGVAFQARDFAHKHPRSEHMLADRQFQNRDIYSSIIEHSLGVRSEVAVPLRGPNTQ